jgi:hypothetical protein
MLTDLGESLVVRLGGDVAIDLGHGDYVQRHLGEVAEQVLLQPPAVVGAGVLGQLGP